MKIAPAYSPVPERQVVLGPFSSPHLTRTLLAPSQEEFKNSNDKNDKILPSPDS